MNLRYMLDTNICIYVLKNTPAYLAPVFDEHARQICVSSVTAMELFYGVECSSKRRFNAERLDSFLARLCVLDYDLKASEHTAMIRAKLRKQGTPIGAYDAMIAGHARAQGLSVVTHNEGEFSRVPGLIVENWLRDTPSSGVNEAQIGYR